MPKHLFFLRRIDEKYFIILTSVFVVHLSLDFLFTHKLKKIFHVASFHLPMCHLYLLVWPMLFFIFLPVRKYNHENITNLTVATTTEANALPVDPTILSINKSI